MSLSPEYASSPWLSLDEDIMSCTQFSPSKEPLISYSAPASPSTSCTESADGAEPLPSLPRKVKSQLMIASECRELLNMLSSRTYNVSHQ